VDEFLKVYEYVERIGFPAFFIFGALRGWWYLRPHVEMLISRIQELSEQAKHMDEATGQALVMVSRSNEIAIEAIALARQNQQTVEEIRTDLKILLDRKE
jgi:hypothetical protein